METLQHDFADTVRIGGLLNQIAYHLNHSYVELINNNIDEITLDAEQLKELCLDVQSQIQVLRTDILELARHRV